MKSHFLLAAVFSAALIPFGQGQEPTPDNLPTLLPSQDLFPAIPAPSETQRPASEPAPETVPEAVSPESVKKGTSAQLRQSIRIRQLKTELLADPAIQDALAKARCAKTDEGRRVLMRNYYTLLYTRIEKADPSVFEAVEKELHDTLVRYEQHQVRPSVLIEPGIKPLPGSRSEDHAPGACKAPSTPPPTPSPTPAPTPFVEAPPLSPS